MYAEKKEIFYYDVIRHMAAFKQDQVTDISAHSFTAWLQYGAKQKKNRKIGKIPLSHGRRTA
jgi:hypothetical protein